MFSLIISCANIPKESVVLTEVIVNDGTNLYDSYLKLVNIQFQYKREMIDDWILTVYVKGIEDLVKDADFEDSKSEFPQILKQSIEHVIEVRDSMQRDLENLRIKINEKILLDRSNYAIVGNSLLHLVKSASDVEVERMKMLETIQNQTGYDLKKLSEELDSLLQKGSHGSKTIEENAKNIQEFFKNFK